MVRWLAETTYRGARRIVVAVVGTTLVLTGVALLFLPGPGVLVLVAGLGVLSVEFVWARRLLRRTRDRATSVLETSRGTLGRLPGFRRADRACDEHPRGERELSRPGEMSGARAGE